MLVAVSGVRRTRQGWGGGVWGVGKLRGAGDTIHCVGAGVGGWRPDLSPAGRPRALKLCVQVIRGAKARTGTWEGPLGSGSVPVVTLQPWVLQRAPRTRGARVLTQKLTFHMKWYLGCG